MNADAQLYRRPRLLAAGFTDQELMRMRRLGELTRVRRGAYVAGTQPEEATAVHRIQVRAAVGELAPGTVVSHVSAAVLHGLPVWSVPLRRVTVTRARPSGGRRDRLLHLRTAALGPGEITLVDGIPCTSVARTLVDLARTAGFESAVVTADAALARHAVTPEELRYAVVRCKGWPGSPRARRVVSFADGRTESVGESRSRVAIAVAGVPEPVPQWEVRAPDGRLVGRTDFGWPASRVLGEFDGRIKYGRLLGEGRSSGDVVYEEKLREDDLRAHGFAVVRWTWDELAHFAPVAGRLWRALATTGR